MNNELSNEQIESIIEQMAQTYFDNMNDHGMNQNLKDARSCYTEWMVDDVDPRDGDYEFVFLPNLEGLDPERVEIVE
tara:strand:+ start:8314 stop:8544 length:231 start_codon:yes stop_codon:yes gene_type:complete